MARKNRKPFGPKVKALARVLIIDEGMNALATEKQLKEMLGEKNAPGKSTLLNWAHKPDKDGKTWMDIQAERIEEIALSMSPKAVANAIFHKFKIMLADKDQSLGSFSDGVWKAVKSITGLLDPRLNFPVIYQTLDDMIAFAESDKYKNIPKEHILFMANFLSDFRDFIRDRMMDGEEAPNWGRDIT